MFALKSMKVATKLAVSSAIGIVLIICMIVNQQLAGHDIVLANQAGVMNLRGLVIPVINLAARLGVRSAVDTSRSAIVVAEVGTNIVGLVVDRVSDILSISNELIQPVPDLGSAFDPAFSHGIIPLEQGMVCFLNLDHMFANLDLADVA